MGFFSNIGKASSYIVNFNVKKWLNLDHIVNSTRNVKSAVTGIFVPQQAEQAETFAEAKTRLKITDADLQQRTKEFNRLTIFYLIISLAIFSYSIYIIYVNNNVGGFFMSIGITIFALSNAFRYHFWNYQIKSKKLGCSLRDWLANR